ncbi:hypothetical protein ACQ858_17095 [Variovorax ureilyticus]|uniref:hypothetical protein n=1 Tax=Variovorax ureilyticus TaxID=1836198 RepID=UPI003D67C4E4
MAKAGVKPLLTTHENVDPDTPDPTLVADLADGWMPGADLIEAEMFVGWTDSEPTRFVRAVSTYLAKHDPAKGAKFDKAFFSSLN